MINIYLLKNLINLILINSFRKSLKFNYLKKHIIDLITIKIYNENLV